MTKKTKKILSSMFLGLLLLVGMGCKEYLTKITMTPEAGKLKREITTSPGDPKNDEVLKFYGICEDNYPDKIEMIISSNFTNHMNGAGSFNSVQTSMGSTNFYSENFLGSRDFAQSMENLDKKIDTGIHLLNGWLQKNLGDTPQYTHLDKFLHSEFKKDVKNVILTSQVHFLFMDRLGRLEKKKKIIIEDGTEDTLRNELTLRCIQYVIEKGYLVPEKDFPLLYRRHGEVVDPLDGSGNIAYVLIHENLKNRFGYSYEQVDRLFDSDEFEDYIANNSLFVEFQNEQRIKKGDPNHVSNMEDFFLSFIEGFDIFPDTDNIDMKLRTRVEPLKTNGVWDEASGIISWNSKIGRGCMPKLPEIVYAFWVSHDINFQEKHFARILVKDDDLLEYCMWHDGLDEQDRNEWNGFISNLNPCSDPNSDTNSQLIYLEEAFSGFEFSEIKDTNLNVIRERKEFGKKGKNILLTEIRRLIKMGEEKNEIEEKKVIGSVK